MHNKNSLTERYLAFYTPLIQEFVREVELLSHPDIVGGIPEPFFPAFGCNYERSALRLIIIGQDTRGFGDLKHFIAAEKSNPGIKLQEWLNEFRDDFVIKYGGHRHSFLGFVMMLLAKLHGQEDWGMMKQGAMSEILDSFAWGNVNAVELYGSTPSKKGIPSDYWAAVRKAAERFDRFSHIITTLKPHVAVVLHRGMNPDRYFHGYQWEQVSSEGRLTHYRLPELDVDVFHAPHPRSMGYIEGAGLFLRQIEGFIFPAQHHKAVPPVFEWTSRGSKSVAPLATSCTATKPGLQ